VSAAARVLICAAALSLGLGCARAQPPEPLLWQVGDADNHIYLLGSFHALKPDDYPLSPKVDAAFADAEALAFEISPEEMDSPELPRAMRRAGTFADGHTLREALPPAEWRRLENYLRKRGLSSDAYLSFEPWFASLIVGLTEMSSLGYDATQGLDHTLMERAKRAGKPAHGLETGAQQIAIFDGMSQTEQRQALSDALDDTVDYRGQIERLHAQWRAGDERALFAGMAADLRKKYPQLYGRINGARNEAWLPELRAMLDGVKGRDTLVVVGSLHLLGPEGLVERLKASGYRVERL